MSAADLPLQSTTEAQKHQLRPCQVLGNPRGRVGQVPPPSRVPERGKDPHDR